MHDAIKGNGCLVLALACALLWANFAWALPCYKIENEPERKVTEELPGIKNYPPIYDDLAQGDTPTGLFDVAATGETWTCANCGGKNPADAKYCSACGTKKGEEAAGTGLSDARVCPKCGFVNEREAKFCGDCGYNFSAAEAGTTARGTVYVPGRGYVPTGTMIDPGHRRTWVWATGLGLWLLVGPAIAAAGIGEKSVGLYITGGTVSLGGLIMFIVGLAVKTDPVYAFRMAEDDGALRSVAYVRESPESEGFTVKIEVPVFSF